MIHPSSSVRRIAAFAAAAAALALLPAAPLYADDASTTPETASTTPALPSAAEPGDAASSSPSEASSTDPAIVTGDAAATAESENDVNEDAADAAAASSTVAEEDAATTTSETDATAETGGNAALAADGDASVATGDAFAAANSVNVVNANIIDSAGLLVFSNLFSSLGIDLRALDLSYFSDGSGCAAADCSDLSVAAEDAATTSSSVTVVADTGGNTASSTGGAAAVATGNAYAAGNAVNVVNSNIIRSNYLLVAVNDFGDLAGNIVLPGAAFFEHLLSSARAGASEVSNGSAAVVTDSTAATADTGGNTASSTGGASSVATGDALSSATSYDQVNSNLVGGSSIYLLFRIWGDWSGSVEGLPPGMSWYDTPSGVAIVNDDGSAAPLAGLGAASASTTDTAAVDNAVNVYALTGANEAAGADASVATGDAYAAANSVNIVNTNILGSNWILAIFNIFGDFSGDISFGEPDLWLGAAAETGNPTLPGSTVTFRFTVSNLGDANATGVRLSAGYLAQMLQFESGEATDGGSAWDLGDIPAGATEEFSYTAQVGDVPDGDSIAVPLSATVSEEETDANEADNTDTLDIVVMRPSAGAGAGLTFTSEPKLDVRTMADAEATSAPATVEYRAGVYNEGGAAFNAVATDVLTGPDGNVVHSQSWDLGTLAYQDEVDVSYAIEYASDTPPGDYVNTFTVSGYKHYPQGSPGAVPFAPVAATSTVTILPPPAAAPPPAPLACAPYLTGYLGAGEGNDPAQVTLLQRFLDEQEGETLAVNGRYDAATLAAVKRFQEKYASDILAPWGYDRPTGLVYYTTVEEINNLACAGERSFALSQGQEEEIAATRAVLAAPRASADVAPLPTSTPSEDALPPGIEVGLAPAAPAAPRASAPSWWQRLIGAPQALLANVLAAFTSGTAQAARR
ncbi:MAG TPA: hypothetical protein VHC68_03245 [Candidatus Paceibacterota bacterium]|nr:hypothetical protein [Candidatus Paceibacterota bacterium]